jgi:hypothetical protein
MKCLEKDPARRYTKAMDLAEDLARALEGKPIIARPIGRMARLWRRAKRNKAAAMGVVGMVLLAAALLLFTLGPGGVTITSVPPGANILIDGEPSNWKTPVKERLLWPPGTYRIGISHDGFDPAELEIRIPALRSGTVSFELVKDHGFVKIAVLPPDAEIGLLIGGERAKADAFRCSPDELPEGKGANHAPETQKKEQAYAFHCFRLPKGAHGLEIVRADFETHKAVLFITPDHVQEIVQVLRRETGSLNVMSNVKDVTMKAYLKGRSRMKPLVFSIPWRDITLEAGRWTLEFEKEGYWKTIRIMNIKKGSRRVLHVSLRKRR